MNVEIEKKPNCLVEVRVSIPPERVDGEWERILGEFRAQARLPGFRPGKAPKNVVERKYRKDIHDELTRLLISEGIRNAIDEHDLAVLSVAKVDDIEIGDDRRMTFSTAIVTAPEFELPEYRGVEVRVPPKRVEDAEIDETLERLRAQHASYDEIEGRAAQLEDYAVLDYEATVDGAPLDDHAPEAAKFFGRNSDFWLRLAEDAFLPGFCQQLLGMTPGESKEFDVGIGDDFPREDLRGLTLHYNVTLKSLRQQRLPALDDDFAARVIEDKSLSELRDLIREDSEHQKERAQRSHARSALIDALLEQVEFELPDSFVRDETRRALEEMVEENRRRGVSEEELANHKDELLGGAERVARHRLRSRFLLIRVARAENIEVSEQELARQISAMAQQHRMRPEQVRKELEKNDALDSVREDLLIGKALDFAVSNANLVEDEELLKQHDHDSAG